MATFLMVVIMGLVTRACVGISRVWTDIGQHRIAMAELSNQLEQLTKIDPTELPAATSPLEASEWTRRTLMDTRLSATLVPSELGTQITVSLDWKRRFPGRPVQLTGWSVHKAATDSEEMP